MGAPEVPKRSWSKGAAEVTGSANDQKVLFVNCTLGVEIVLLVPDLICKHAAVGFGCRGRVKGKGERKR